MNRRSLLIATGGGAVATWLGATPLIASAAASQTASSAASAAATPGAPSRPSLEQQLAQYAADIHYAQLPREVVQSCKRLLLDALACAFGAVGTPPARIAAQTYRRAYGSGGKATVIGSAEPIATEGAVLVNGTLLRQLDLNDVYFGKDPSHPSEIIPAALACCEEQRCSGRDLIEALVVGYETEVRLNDAFSWASHGLIASSAAAFLAPLVIGKAWHLPVEQVVNAIGISGPRQLTALAVNSGEISMMKSVGPGYTVMDAVFSTRLAAAGMSGVTGALTWLAANMKPQSEIPLDLSPGHYVLDKVGLKRFPLQGELQAVAEAGANLHGSLGAKIAAIARIDVQAYPGTLGRGVAEPEKFRPASRETADHSLPIFLAIALLDGDVTVRQYVDGRWRAPDVLALAQKIHVTASPSLVAQMPNGHGTIVDVHLEDGRTVNEQVLIPEGDAQRPMSQQAMEHKFRQFAEPVLGAAGAGRVMQAVQTLENLDDVNGLTALLRPS